ncbi:MAG: PAS domain-containing protein [Candidatus Nanopelagicales bacterium]
MRPIVTPTGVERIFSPEEIIVTKTDLHGRITYANEVFCRVSALEEADVVGQPHSLIRHPEMPRGVFRLLWDRLQRGQEVFAYVKNLAADGQHYWVFAHVTPTFDDLGRIRSFHSSRRSPDRAAVNAIVPVYLAMLEAEAAYSKATDAAAAGFALLMATAEENGMTYDEFVWSLTRTAAA